MLVFALAIAVISLLPVAYLLIREGLNPGRLSTLLSSPTTSTLIRNTVLLSFWVTISCVVLGVSLAVLVVFVDIPARRFWMVLFTLPLGVPAFVSTYTWVALGYKLVPSSTFIYGLRGAVVVLTLSLYPYVYLPTVAALRGLDSNQESVARALGRGPLRTFFEVILPQLRVPIAGGALIIALHMLAEYGALELLRFRTLTTAIIQRATVLGSLESARALSIVLTFGAVILLTADTLFLRKAGGPVRVGSGVRQARTPWQPGKLAIPLIMLASTVVLISLGIPLYGMLSGLYEIIIGNASVDWRALASVTWNTTRYALATAAVVTVAALPVSLLVVRYPRRAVFLVERATWIAHSLPGVVVALGLVYFAVRWLHPFYQTSALLVVGYAILYLPIAVGAQRAGLSQASMTLDDIARTLGRSPIMAFFTVTLPIALPGILAGVMLVILNVGKELTMTLLLRPTGTHTLATKLWSTTDGEVLDFTNAAPYAVTIILLTAAPTYLLIRTSLTPTRPS